MEQEKLIEEVRPAQQPKADVEKGRAWGKMGSGMIRFAVGIVLFALICSVPFWWGRWWMADQSVSAAPSYSHNVAIPTPERVGYPTAGDATTDGCPAERVIPIWRAGKIAGYGCNRDNE